MKQPTAIRDLQTMRELKTSKSKSGALAATAMLALTVLPATAQEATLDETARKAVIDTICAQLMEGYIYEETAEKLVTDLRRRQSAGEYDALSDAMAFAERLTHDLYAVSSDKHLRVRSAVAVADGPRRARRSRGDLGSMIGKVQVLDGNIGYLEINHFSGGEEVAPDIDTAMASLKDVDALIIDVGRNPGGGPFPLRYLSAYLFDGKTHLASTYGRGWPEPRERWTVDQVSGERLSGIPVLTSKKTFSAAESFTFGLKVNDRITQVGERTGGGGHWGGEVDLGHGLSMFLPAGRTYDPKTGKGWEAEGLKPEIEVEYEKALDEALRHARSSIGAAG